jgi:hypothetical protein
MLSKKSFCTPHPTLRLLQALVATSIIGVLPVWSDHDVPYYPSFYPQEIRIEAIAPTAAARALRENALHAYIGATPDFAGAVAEHLKFLTSLHSYVLVTFNPASAVLQQRQQRCMAARQLLASLATVSQEVVFHPYPVTPYHADYLQHIDRVAAVKAALGTEAGQEQHNRVPMFTMRTRGPLSERLMQGRWRLDDVHWDAMLEEVSLEELALASGFGLHGGSGPPWEKEGWFQASALLMPTLSDPVQRQTAEALQQRLVRGEYGGMAERLNLERQLLAGLTQGCERVVVGYTLRREYYTDDFSAGVENLAYDAQLGFNTPVFIRTVKLKDFLWNGWLRLGVEVAPTTAWNPVGGFTDPFGRLLWAAVGDSAFLPVPYNASWVPNRVSAMLSVEMSGAEDIKIPREAVIPQPGTGILSPVVQGRSSTAKVTYRVLTSAFQDGTAMEVADLLYPYVLAYRWGVQSGPDDMAYDSTVAAATAVLRERLAGIRVIGVEQVVRQVGDTEVLQLVPIVEVYLDYTAPDPWQVAALAPPWSSAPWHMLVLMEEAVQRGLAAFSQAEAGRHGVAWLDVVRSEPMHKQLQALVAEFAHQGYRPAALQDMVTVETARQRWTALQEFARSHGHFLVTNGPYRLSTWSQDAVVLQVIRDLSYPVGLASFNGYTYPPRAVLTQVQRDSERVWLQADVEKTEQALRSARVVREPLKPGVLQGVSQLQPVCRYVLLGPDGVVLRTGTAAWGEDGRFTMNPIEGGLASGQYTLLVAIYLNNNAIDPGIVMVPYDVK